MIEEEDINFHSEENISEFAVFIPSIKK